MKHDDTDDSAHDAGDDAAEPAGARGRAVPFSVTVGRWAPIAAGVIRAIAGLLAFSAALLTLPTHVATPFLTGVGLLMLVGGCVAVVKACQDEPQLRWFSRSFPLVCGVIAMVVVGVVVVYGAGALAPDIFADPAPRAPVDDGTVRFQSN